MNRTNRQTTRAYGSRDRRDSTDLYRYNEQRGFRPVRTLDLSDYPSGALFQRKARASLAITERTHELAPIGSGQELRRASFIRHRFRQSPDRAVARYPLVGLSVAEPIIEDVIVRTYATTPT